MEQKFNNSDALNPHNDENRDEKDNKTKEGIICVDTPKIQDPKMAINDINVNLQNVEKGDEKYVLIKSDVISVDTPIMQDPEIATNDSAQHINLHDTAKYDIKKISVDFFSNENKAYEDKPTDQKSSKEEVMEINHVADLKDNIIVTGLSDEVQRLNPDVTAFNNLRYGRGLRRLEKKVIKEEPKIIEKPKQRKKVCPRKKKRKIIEKPKKRKKKEERKKSSKDLKKPKTRDQHKRGQKEHQTELIECKFCSKTFKSKSGLGSHMRLHNINVQDLAKVNNIPQPFNYKCALCTQLFKTNKKLLSHKKEKHSKIDTFMCKYCKLAFGDHYACLVHNMTHRSPQHSPFPCPECRKIFNTKTGYKIHIGFHFESKFPCDVCMKTFGSEYNIILHKKNVHDRVRETKICPECDKPCNGTKGLNYHMQFHTGMRLYQCLYCGIGFRSASSRQSHTLTLHTDEKPYECETCHQKFRQTSNLRHHNCLKEKRFVCEYCDKKFTQYNSLNQHRRRHTNTGLYKCPECDHTSTIRGSLRTHMIHVHMTEKLHRCDICDLGFKMNMDLQRHLKSLSHRNNTFGFMKKKGDLKNEKLI